MPFRLPATGAVYILAAWPFSIPAFLRTFSAMTTSSPLLLIVMDIDEPYQVSVYALTPQYMVLSRVSKR